MHFLHSKHAQNSLLCIVCERYLTAATRLPQGKLPVVASLLTGGNNEYLESQQPRRGVARPGRPRRSWTARRTARKQREGHRDNEFPRERSGQGDSSCTGRANRSVE